MLQRLSFIMIVCLASVALAACGGGTTQPATAPTTAASASTQATSVPPTTAPTLLPPTATSTAEPTAEPTQPAVLSGTAIDMNNPLFKAYFAVYNKFPRRMSAEVFDADTQKVTTVLIETDTKDHLRVETGGAADEAFAIIVISPTMYIKQDGTWMELPGAQSSMFLSMLTDVDSLQQLLNAFDELANYTVRPVGPETVNGVPAMAYASEFILKDGSSST
ncbi:MAG: hypothetical protein HGB05_09940, partial [Chloroflexi bacterium]|nr:hypothetical protein [Chloroflexota bacterium]